MLLAPHRLRIGVLAFVREAHYRSCQLNLEHLGQRANLKCFAREMRVM